MDIATAAMSSVVSHVIKVASRITQSVIFLETLVGQSAKACPYYYELK